MEKFGFIWLAMYIFRDNKLTAFQNQFFMNTIYNLTSLDFSLHKELVPVWISIDNCNSFGDVTPTFCQYKFQKSLKELYKWNKK